MFEAGGIPILMKTLLDNGFLHGDCITVTGRTIAENMAKVKPGTRIRTWCYPADKPITVTGGVVGLEGFARAGGRHRQGRRHAGRGADLQGSRALLRLRGGLLRRR